MKVFLRVQLSLTDGLHRNINISMLLECLLASLSHAIENRLSACGFIQRMRPFCFFVKGLVV